MTEKANVSAIDVPASLIAPVKLSQDAAKASCGLFFPYRTNLPTGLVVEWEGDTHLIHLEGSLAFQEGAVGIGNPIRGVVINDVEYRVDLTSRYNSVERGDPPGALVLKAGALYLCCTKLGDQFHGGPYLVPLGGNYQKGGADEACGFTRWSIAVRENDEVKVILSLEALPSED